MKLKDIEVGKSYRLNRGRWNNDEIVYVIDKRWKNNPHWRGPRFLPGGSGVAVARRYGSGPWSPDVVPPAQLAEAVTEQEWEARQAAARAAQRERALEASRREAAVETAAAKLRALGVPAHQKGWGISSQLAVDSADLAKLTPLLDRLLATEPVKL